MNEDTRVAVSCYAGDQQQVEQMLGQFLHHECPVTVLSPEDAPCNVAHWRVDNRHFGKRGQLGPDAWERHLGFLKILLTYPEQHFLIHESDSICLDPRIPDFLYAEPDIVWSNNGESTPDHWDGFPPGSAKMSFQAPWFFSRKTIQAMIDAAPRVPYHPSLEWVDLYLSRLTEEAGLEWRGYGDRAYLGPMSGCIDDNGTTFDPGHHDPSRGRQRGMPLAQSTIETYDTGLKNGIQYAENGACMMHSVKNGTAARALATAYQTFLDREV
jgi:hypothetical protein